MQENFKYLLKDNTNFKEIMAWLEAEKQQVIHSLGGRFDSDQLQRLSGSLSIMNHLIHEVEKEKPKR